jgi:hypothetical protein
MPTPSNTGCEIQFKDDELRVRVGPALPEEAQRCYRRFANECITRGCNRVLIVGSARLDAFAHLALRDALASMALAGVRAGLRIALVAETADLIAVYDAAVVEAGRLGMEARRFTSHDDAVRWLAS